MIYLKSARVYLPERLRLGYFYLQNVKKGGTRQNKDEYLARDFRSNNNWCCALHFYFESKRRDFLKW